MRGELGENGLPIVHSLSLDPNHRRMLLEDSGIGPDVVRARGYRSAHRKVELSEKGFSRNQQSVPGL
jgi:hypothetical protein